jgi:hypothetical protein
MNLFKTLVHYTRNGHVPPGGRRAGFVLVLAGLVASIALSLALNLFFSLWPIRNTRHKKISVLSL